MTEKFVRKAFTLADGTEVTKNVVVNSIFRGGTLATLVWEMIQGMFSNDPYRAGAGMGGYIDKLLF